MKAHVLTYKKHLARLALAEAAATLAKMKKSK